MRKKVNNRVLVIMLLIGVALFLPACAKKEQAPPPQQAAPQPKPTTTAVPSPAVQQQATSVKAQAQFDFSTKKDPFKPFAPEPLPGKPGAVPGASKHGRVQNVEEVLPIQSYDVTKFRVAGIILGLKENSALIIDPKGKGYVVKQGMPLGNNNGHITKIASTYIEVTEQYREENGRIRKSTTRLTLPQKK